MIAVGTGTGVGINALVSRSLGEKKQEYANSAANNGIYLAIFSFIGFAIVCGFFAPAFFRVQTTDPQIMEYGVDYVRVIGIMSFGLFIQLTCEKLLQSTGKTIYSMATQLLGAIINIILDHITGNLIFHKRNMKLFIQLHIHDHTCNCCNDLAGNSGKSCSCYDIRNE